MWIQQLDLTRLDLSQVKCSTYEYEMSWMSWQVLTCQEHTHIHECECVLSDSHSECECEFNSLTQQDRWVLFLRLTLILILIINECEYNTIQSTMYRNRYYIVDLVASILDLSQD